MQQRGLLSCFAVLCVLVLLAVPQHAAGDDGPCDNPRGGCPTLFGVETGAVFQFNESFITDAIRNAWDANGLGSPRGDFFLGDPATASDDDMDGYVSTEPLAIQSANIEHLNDPAYDYRRLPWVDRLPGMWDDMMNLDDNVYPEDDDNLNRAWSTDYLYLPLGDDCNQNLFGPGCAQTQPHGGWHTFAAESCPEGFFDGLSPDNRTAIRMLSDSQLESRLQSLNGWPDPAEVNDPDTGIGPEAYSLLLHFARELERTPHNDYNRYSFFTPGPNWLRILSPVAVIREPDNATAQPYLELRFPLFGVYNPMGCAGWYYTSPGDRGFSESDVKVSWAVLIIRARLELDLAGPRPVLYILMDPGDPSTVDFDEGNLREGLQNVISGMTVDPDWIAAGLDAADWYAQIKELAERRYTAFFGQIENLVSLGITIANIQDLMTIPLDPLMENYDNLIRALEEFGFTFQSLGLVSDPLATIQFKMWEEHTAAGQHRDGICALGMEFLQMVDITKWENAQTDFIPDGKQFALSMSNGALNSLLPPIADAFSKPTDPPGGTEDRCGNKNFIDHLQITDLDLTIPSGQNLGGIPQITRVEGTVGFRMPWWAYVAAAALVAAAAVWVGLTLGLSPTAWAFLALAIAILAAIGDFDINRYTFHATYADDDATFSFHVAHENSIPRIDADISLTEVHLDPEFSVLTTIANPVLGGLLSFVPEWIGYSFDKPIPVENVLLTGFRFSFNQMDTTIAEWLADLRSDYAAAGCSAADTGASCEVIRQEWRAAEGYRKYITFIKANVLEHYDYEMLIAGHLCLPPEFYDLEEVIQTCDEDNEPAAVTIDRCVNFYDEDFAGEQTCEDYIAVCNNFTEALSAGGDTVETSTHALTIGEEERDSIFAGIVELWEVIINCDSTEADFLGTSIVQDLAGISPDAYDEAQRALQCLPYGSYTPSGGCTPNATYAARVALLDALYAQSSADGGLSDESSQKLAALAAEVRRDVYGSANDSNDDEFAGLLNTIVVYVNDVDPCNGTSPGPLPGRDQGMLWDHPWEDTDLDGDGFERFAQPVDCNDFDKTVFPGAPELCNEVDDDCDGRIDEDFDKDGDGVSTCDDPPDCNDFNKNMYPGAVEICGNMLDDDCDGLRDEDECEECPDEDGDGFSPRGVFCGRTDCDDTRADIYPGAPEQPGDNLDYNCNGLDDCFIATAAYGSPLDTRIDTLRRFRDGVLERTAAGRLLVRAYYRMSPAAARLVRKHGILRSAVRAALAPLVAAAAWIES